MILKGRWSGRSSSAVFGRSLQELSAERGGPPAVFKDTLKWLSQHALTIRGLFETSMDQRKVQLMKRLYNEGQDPLKMLGIKDSLAIAGLLKLWLASLPEPLIPLASYEAVLQTQRLSNQRQRLASLQRVLKQVPKCHLQVLYPLLEFLHHYQVNQRNSVELASLMTALILADRPHGKSTVEATLIVEQMIREYRTLFTCPLVSSSVTLELPPATLSSAAAAHKPSSPKRAAAKAEPIGPYDLSQSAPAACLIDAGPSPPPLRIKTTLDDTSGDDSASDEGSASAASTGSSSDYGLEGEYDPSLHLVMDGLLFSSTGALFTSSPALPKVQKHRRHAHRRSRSSHPRAKAAPQAPDSPSSTLVSMALDPSLDDATAVVMAGQQLPGKLFQPAYGPLGAVPDDAMDTDEQLVPDLMAAPPGCRPQSHQQVPHFDLAGFDSSKGLMLALAAEGRFENPAARLSAEDLSSVSGWFDVQHAHSAADQQQLREAYQHCCSNYPAFLSAVVQNSSLASA